MYAYFLFETLHLLECTVFKCFQLTSFITTLQSLNKMYMHNRAGSLPYNRANKAVSITSLFGRFSLCNFKQTKHLSQESTPSALVLDLRESPGKTCVGAVRRAVMSESFSPPWENNLCFALCVAQTAVFPREKPERGLSEFSLDFRVVGGNISSRKGSRHLYNPLLIKKTSVGKLFLVSCKGKITTYAIWWMLDAFIQRALQYSECISKRPQWELNQLWPC